MVAPNARAKSRDGESWDDCQSCLCFEACFSELSEPRQRASQNEMCAWDASVGFN
jgi:hypothetical protein